MEVICYKIGGYAYPCRSRIHTCFDKESVVGDVAATTLKPTTIVILRRVTRDSNFYATRAFTVTLTGSVWV